MKVKYIGKSYYPMTKKEYLIKSSTYNIIYYCNNHLLNTQTKKLIFKGNACNGKIEYNRDNNKFFLIHSHNDILNTNKPQIYDNIGKYKKMFMNSLILKFI